MIYEHTIKNEIKCDCMFIFSYVDYDYYSMSDYIENFEYLSCYTTSIIIKLGTWIFAQDNNPYDAIALFIEPKSASDITDIIGYSKEDKPEIYFCRTYEDNEWDAIYGPNLNYFEDKDIVSYIRKEFTKKLVEVLL